MMRAGGLELKNSLALAPLAGITTLPVRELFSRLGASLTHTEMISCAGLIRDNDKTLDMLKISAHEGPTVIQLFAPDENILADGACRVISNVKNFSALGVNMACPMPKITRGGSGAALLRKPDIAAKMVQALKVLNFPVWVKIRRLENYDDTLKFVEVLASSGADNICIHGRTASQRYEGLADRKIISLAAEKFPGLISASGDVKTLADIQEYLSYGCVVVMLARGALINPWLFEEFHGIHKNYDERLEDLITFARRAREFSGEHKAVVLLKKFAGSMLRFHTGSAELRRLAGISVSLEELINILRRGY